jgi:hypothetical protein
VGAINVYSEQIETGAFIGETRQHLKSSQV